MVVNSCSHAPPPHEKLESEPIGPYNVDMCPPIGEHCGSPTALIHRESVETLGYGCAVGIGDIPRPKNNIMDGMRKSRI